jgi:hypothetical protein
MAMKEIGHGEHGEHGGGGEIKLCLQNNDPSKSLTNRHCEERVHNAVLGVSE